MINRGLFIFILLIYILQANMLSEDVKRLEHEKNSLKYDLESFCESLSKVL